MGARRGAGRDPRRAARRGPRRLARQGGLPLAQHRLEARYGASRLQFAIHGTVYAPRAATRCASGHVTGSRLPRLGVVEKPSLTLARWWPSFRSTVAMSALVAIVAACQPGPSGSPGMGSPELQVSP